MKLKLIQGSKTTSHQGFSLLEATIASLISFTFLCMGANLVIAANIQKIVAKRNITMNNLVQSDLDGIKYQANLLAKDAGVCKPKPTGTWTIANGYAFALKKKIVSGTTTNTAALTTTQPSVLGQNHKMVRTIHPIRDRDENILPIEYEFFWVDPSDSTHEVSKYKIYTEVIPSASLSCS